MPHDSLPVTLRIEPHAIPAIRMAYQEAAVRVGSQLHRLRREGVIREPWLGDETSQAVYETYNSAVMESAEGPYSAMVAYEAQLLRVHDQLQQMEDAYRRTEGDVAELWGRA